MVDYAMNLVLRLERGRGPRRVDALEAAANVVLRVCLLHTTGEGGSVWRAWQAAPRKLVRRARGSHWHAAVAEADVNLCHGSAEILAFAPVSVAETPSLLKRLQVEGTHLADNDGLASPIGSAPAVLWLNPLLGLTAGKAMAQVGHAAVQLWEGLDRDQQDSWLRHDLTVAVRKPEVDQWQRLASTSHWQVRDGGLTEIQPGTITVIPEWRDLS